MWSTSWPWMSKSCLPLVRFDMFCLCLVNFWKGLVRFWFALPCRVLVPFLTTFCPRVHPGWTPSRHKLHTPRVGGLNDEETNQAERRSHSERFLFVCNTRGPRSQTSCGAIAICKHLGWQFIDWRNTCVRKWKVFSNKLGPHFRSISLILFKCAIKI